MSIVRKQIKWKKMVDVVFCLKGFLYITAGPSVSLLSLPSKQTSNPPDDRAVSVVLESQDKKRRNFFSRQKHQKTKTFKHARLSEK
jgi:hypothetical protein